jgi:uncharacterized RDD family membrane protein YckC
MKMDEHARAWTHEFVAGILNRSGLAPDQRSSLHWEILSHVHEAAERRAVATGGTTITLAHVQAVVHELGGADGIAKTFLDQRVAGMARAGFGKRAAAYIIDVLLLVLAFGALSALFVPFFWFGFFPWNATPLPYAAAAYAYFVVMEYRAGATLGKMAFKLRAVDQGGAPLTIQAALVRNIAKVFPPLLLIDVIVYLVAFRADDQRGSDRIAETIVVDTTRPAATSPPVPPAPYPPVERPREPPDQTHQWRAVDAPEPATGLAPGGGKEL